MIGRTCCFPSCGAPAAVKYLCDGHYQQRKAGKPLVPLQQTGSVCRVDGCEAAYEAKGYCAYHYERWRASGDPEAPSRKEPSSVVEIDGVLRVQLGGEQAGGAVTLVSPRDRELVEGHSWWMTSYGYAEGKIDGVKIRLHRLILACPDNRQVDHINGDRLDNRRENLRVVTFPEQMQNKKPWGKSGYRNVHPTGEGRWRVIVTKDGVRHDGGRFDDVALAVAAAEELRGKLFTHHVEDRTTLD